MTQPWLTQPRSELAAEQILLAAERLFAEHGPAGVGMAEIARAAGCSRATLYRHFENRRALQTAFAVREATRILDTVRAETSGIRDPQERAVSAVLTVLGEIRSRPVLAAWTRPENAGELLAVLRDAPLVEAFAARAVTPDDGEPDLDAARWLIRAMVSLLALPPANPAEEERLVERFIAPMVDLR